MCHLSPHTKFGVFYLHIYLCVCVCVCVCVFLSVFLGLHLQHMEVPRLGVAPTTATAVQDLSHVCDLHRS